MNKIIATYSKVNKVNKSIDNYYILCTIFVPLVG